MSARGSLASISSERIDISSASTRQSLFTDRTEDVMKIIEKVMYSIHDTKIVQLAVCGKFA